MDIVDAKKRSQMMSNIRSKNTQPEIELRRFLFHCGVRFRIHVKDLPGHPDIAMRKHKAIIFVHGCYWHHHRDCKYATIPKTRSDFWINKFNNNIHRDQIVQELLISLGWRVLVVWECELRTNKQITFEKVLQWIKNTSGESV